MKQKLLSFLAVCLFFVGIAHAQTRQVTGRVTSAEDGTAISGATVLVQGTNQATQTNSDGYYSIQVVEGGTLVFRYVGYTAETVRVGATNVINVVLQSDENIEEVVVVGYGTAQSVASVVASVATVTAKQIQDRPRANVLESLQGQVAGLQVFTSSGEPSATQSVRLRGSGSLSAGTTPLYVVDGIPLAPESAISLNPEDFESVTVLKDAAATSIYGSRAANGVIYFTTKKGRAGETATIKYRGMYGWSNLAQTKMQENVLTGQQLLDFWVETGYRTQEQADQLRADNPDDYEWFRYYYKEDRPMHMHDLNITGGSQRTRYYLSTGLYDEEGLMYRSGFERITFRSNIDTRLNDWARVGLNLSGGVDERELNGWGTNNTNGGLALLVPGFYSPFKEDGTPYYDEVIPGWGRYAPNYLADMQPAYRKRNQFTPTAYVEIQPIEGLTIRTQGGMDYNTNRYTFRRMPSMVTNPNFGAATEEYWRERIVTLTNTIEYNWDVGERHRFSALAGQEFIDRDYEFFSAQSAGQTDDRLTLLGAGPQNRTVGQNITEYAFNSFFGRVSYNLDGKYYINLTGRQDNSSRFGRNNEAANFWSIGGMWELSKETFMDPVSSWLQDVQVRASYGTTGNAEIGNYQHLATVGTSMYNQVAAWGISTAGNPNLGWERQSQYNFGVQGSLFNSLAFNVEYYNRTTTNMLLLVPYPYTSGFSDIYDNVGGLVNRGVDVELQYNIPLGDDLTIVPRITYNYNRQEITELFQGRDYWIVPNTGIGYVVGQPVGFFYPIRADVNPETGQQQWYVPGENVMVTNMDPNDVTTTFSTAALNQYTGMNRYAPHIGGFGLDATYKGFFFSTQFAFAKGQYLFNNDRYFFENPAQFAGFNQSNTVLDYWREPGDIAAFPRFGSVNQFDSGLIEDASFLRMKTLSVGYNLPRSLTERTRFFKSARVFYMGRNLLTFTNYMGPDPEIDSNITLGANPNTKQSSIGLEFTF